MTRISKSFNDSTMYPYLIHRHLLIYTITKGLFESKANHPAYRKSDEGICSSIDSIRVTIRRSTSASPWTRFFSDSKS